MRRLNSDHLFFAALAIVAAFCFYAIATAPPTPPGQKSDTDDAMEWYLNPGNPLSPLSPAYPGNINNW